MKAIDKYQEKISLITQKIENSSNNYSEIDDKCTDVIEQLNIKSGGENSIGENSTSIVVKIKEGIKNLKIDIKMMTIHSGFLAATLLSKKKIQSDENLIKLKNKRKNRSKHSAFSKSKEKIDNDNDNGDGNSY
jgi:hypothetical protein